ncbi:MAG TPA: acetyl-CoA C-acyltransferase FadI [Euzebyales bacterium]|nr:acetyl-CoA C-acyltransferase FadI [Euzebyales bacterium]
MAEGNGRRVAIVDGVRTPFTKRAGALAGMTAIDLGRHVVSEVVDRNDVDPSSVGQVVFGQVILDPSTPNIAREIVLGTGLPPTVEAYSVSKACITSYQTTVNIAQAIAAGVIDCGVAGGAESASNVPVLVSPALQDAFRAAAEARSLRARVQAFADVRPGDLAPRPPDLTEPSTQETMGQSAERMAKINGIDRSAQDDFAHRSHVLAARGWNEGKLPDEVVSVDVPPRYEETVDVDTTVRFDSDRRRYDDLAPVFDRHHGTLTAGNSSPLTDGAAALLLMSEDRAEAEGREPLGWLRSYAFTALDPADQLLLGPVSATPIALQRAGVAFDDLDLIDLHEAFAAQVLSVTQAFASAEMCKRYAGVDEPIGEVDWNIVNVLGGSIALGHPFAATGARQIAQTLHELRRRGGGVALCSACAAGGMGAAMILEA